MPTTSNFNVQPYNDDYDALKKFYKILFRPAYAIQARELTQLQSILQNQLGSFGEHIFKDGSMVIPGTINVNTTYEYVRLQKKGTSTGKLDFPSENITSLSDLIDAKLTGANGVTAVIKNTADATTTDPPTIFVQYEGSDTTNNVARFTANETITCVLSSGTTLTGGLQVEATALNAILPVAGQGSAVTIEEGVYFINGFFVKNSAQTLILDKYFNVPSYRIGFLVTQSFVNSFTDPSLNDNATGTSNLNAPGADRYSISLALAKKSIGDTDDTDFVELLQVNTGEKEIIVDRPDYNLLEETLARRTFDESGNYVIKNFEIDIREHRKNGNNRGIYSADSDSKFERIYTQTESDGLLAVGMSPGKAYVEGYENETTSQRFVTVSKGRDFETIQNSITRLSLGNSTNVTKIFGSPDLSVNTGKTETYKELTLLKAATSTRGTANAGSGTTLNTIGTARPRYFEYVSGTVGASASNATSVYKLGLFDIKFFTHLTVAQVTAGQDENDSTITFNINSVKGKILTQPSTGASGVIEGVSNASTGGAGVYILSNVKGNFVTSTSDENTFVFDSTGRETINNVITPVLTRGAKASITAVSNPFTFKDVKQVAMAGSPTFTADTVLTNSNATLDGLDTTCPIYKLPQRVIKTLKTTVNSGVADTLHKVRRTFVSTIGSNGQVSFSASSNETFVAYSPIDYTLSIMTAGASAGTVGDIINLTTGAATSTLGSVSIGGNPSGNTITITMPTTSANFNGAEVKFTATITRSVTQEKSKILQSGVTTSIGTAGASNTANNKILVQSSSISLGKADGFKLNSVHMSADFATSATTSDTDITSRFDFDDGQRESYYDIARINLKPGAEVPTGLLLINFDHFTHGAGDYFSVDSYSIDYTTIPTFSSSTKGTLNLRDCIDFRPRVSDDSHVIGFDGDATGAKQFDGTNASPVNTPKPGSDFICDFEFFLARIDSIGINIHGQFKASKGVPSLDPQRPKPLDNVMNLYYLYIPPYTFSTNNVKITPINNRRYTMRDIGRLEQRLRNVEYYTQLSFLESNALNSEVLDSSGNNRFKNGILVDTFEGHNIAETTAFDHQCSIDMTEGELRPPFAEKFVELEEINTTDSTRTANGYQKTGKLITLPYTHTTLAQNLFASKAVNCNPFLVFQYVGAIELDPDLDDWRDQTQRETLNVTNDALFDTVTQLGDSQGNLGTVWNGWETTDFGTTNDTQISPGDVEVETTIQRSTETRTRVGTGRTLGGFTTQQQSFGERVVDISLASFIRTRTLTFTATRMKPNTRLFAFFDEEPVSSFCTVSGVTTDNDNVGVGTTDASGKLTGTFTIPDPNVSGNPKFRTGDRVFRLTSSSNNSTGTSLTDDEVETFADATYTARGLRVTTQETVQSTRVPQINKTSVTETDTRTTIDNISVNASADGIIDSISNLQETTENQQTQIDNLSQRVRDNANNINNNRNNIERNRGNIAGITRFLWPPPPRIFRRRDPLAQTFLNGQPGDASGSFVTKIDLYFKKKHDTLPIEIYMTPTNGGRPTRAKVPFSSVTLESSQVNVSEDASAVTTVTFPSPIYLMPNKEYSIVLKPDNTDYEAWVSRLGQNQLGTTQRITQQPLLGSLFRSQNASVWTEDQYEDLKFTIYKAKFTTATTGNIDLQNTAIPADTLDNSPFETSSSAGTGTKFGFNPNIVRVHHKNHGMNSASPSKVTIANVASNTYNGIASTNLEGTFDISNVTADSYTISAKNSAAATASGRVGGSNITATRENNFQLIRPVIGQMTYDTGKLNHSVKTTTARSPQGSETPYTFDTTFRTLIPNESYYYTSNRSILSTINETTYLNNTKSFVYRISMTTFDENTSPVLDLNQVAVLAVNNRINSLTANKVLDTTTASSGTPATTYTLDRILTEAEEDLLTVTFDGNITTAFTISTSSSESSITFTSSITLTNSKSITAFLDDQFVPETNAQGGSALAKYLTKEIVLNNPSTALDVRLSASVPPESEIEVFRKVKSPEDSLRMGEIPYVKLNADIVPPPNSNRSQSPYNADFRTDFSEFKFSESGIPEFTSFQIKIVMKGTNPAYPPRIKDLRTLALAL